jgi:hypothetical protein
MRVKINSHLDTLEQNILKELGDSEYKIKTKASVLPDREISVVVVEIPTDFVPVFYYVVDIVFDI